MVGRKTFIRAALALVSLVGTAPAQEDLPGEGFGDPDDDTPPTKAYREAVRVKGIGVKVGEVTSSSALVWARTPPLDEAHYRRKRDFVAWLKSLFVEEDLQVRMRYGLSSDASDGEWSEWADAGVETDFTKCWTLDGLTPDTEYFYRVEGADETLAPLHSPRIGRFRTSPDSGQAQSMRFTVVGCQRYDRLDDPKGYAIYEAMARLQPDFTVLTGDTVYMDRGPVKARTLELARDRWRRTYELPYLYDYHAQFPAYWQKDDHDILKDDAGPMSTPYGELTFEDGVQIFRQHTPVGEVPYRSVRWGSLAEVWLLEGREFRVRNTDPDGPDKTLLGPAQKAWLRRTLLASNAAWRIVITPTPIVGPDRTRFKRDNLANSAWDHESEELRSFFASELGDNFFVIAGDRHWQYCSSHPQDGVQEYGCGPATDAHAGGSPGRNRRYHRFHRVAGGFLSATIGRDDTDYAIVRLHSVDGQVVFEERKTRSTSA